MKFFSVTAIALALASSASAAFSSCGAATDSFQLSGISYAPNPPKVNQNVCVTVNGSLSKPVIQGSSIRVTGHVWGLKVYDQTSDLCAALAGSATPCPIATTVTSVTHCITVPSEVPAGVSITLKATATNGSGERLFCISGPLTFTN
ncbi:hypothetical protein BX616_006458 [Lobosporangium transversale]|uniref:Phosphatidylglycerol/phosphatidylinositol transfer protein n=1 Tax=Lobosporangium transversale TaxID=64571 RepID=A0A1Y2H2D8_9FUNG|nr:hypothetical protein BCR41DRAFT_382683 [Lobosporangium transversale]KAF9896947.1 hypothetical protein BX616_006458 [Lobosporangium transversale]ORZ28716.1 hypothetical protein BCR41DRAFT_382683 [Lobosporangium transversale]|eukprot:XP_021886389.1 hypothetical protein BCR41DRAFT_382683 [Lobosporangium transversale]